MTDSRMNKMNYDPTHKGPLRKRSCTDTFWLLIFMTFLACWGAVSKFGIKNGNIKNLYLPTDTEGRQCGEDSEVRNKPNLLFFDLSKCIGVKTHCPTTQVCVEKCPAETFFYSSYKTDKSVEEIKTKLICKIEVNKSKIKHLYEIDRLIRDEQCASWYLNSTSITGRCIPTEANFNTKIMTYDELQNVSKYIRSLADAEENIKIILKDFWISIYHVAVIAGISAFASLFYIILLRWFATPCVYTTLFTVTGASAYGTYRMIHLYIQNKTEWQYLAVLILCALITSILLLSILFCHKRIFLACQIIKEASKAVTYIMSTLIFPILPWILHIVVIIFGVYIGLMLRTIYEPVYRVQKLNDDCECLSSLNYSNNSDCDPEKFLLNCKESGRDTCVSSGCHLVSKVRPWFINYFHAVNVFGFYWLYFFISAFGEMVLAATFATWYWTFKKEKVPFFTITVSFYRTIRYHLGTLAFGALILTVCRIIRIFLEYLNAKVKKANNSFATAIMCCCRWLFYVLENFLKYINNNAYIMCAIHGKSFCRSAQDAFSLLMRNIVRVIVITRISNLLLLTGKIVITTMSVVVSYWYFTVKKPGMVTYWYVPATMTGISSFLITSVFFKVVTAAIDTLFLCFLEDCDRNDGSSERPYFMSKRLKKLLRK